MKLVSRDIIKFSTGAICKCLRIINAEPEKKCERIGFGFRLGSSYIDSFSFELSCFCRFSIYTITTE